MKKKEMPLILKMGYVNHMLFKRSVGMMEAAGLSRGMPMILDYLHEKGSCIQRELAEQHHMNPASVTSALNTMESCGFIARTPTENDKRAISVSLTELGQQKHAELQEIHGEIERICLGALTAEQKSSFDECLNVIIGTMKKIDERAV